jgi:hypothetical protein
MRGQFNVLCTLGILFVLAACNAFSPTPVLVPVCNECLDMLTINLEGAVPQDYELSLVFPAGEVAGVHCVNGQTEENWVYGMPVRDGRDTITCINDRGRDYAFYFGTPSSFTVTLTWDDNQIVQHYEPTYEEYWGCDGLCYSGAISVTIPISP